MKILYYIDSNDSRVNGIVDTIKEAGYAVGYLTELDQKSIYEFSPDIIIHNIPNVARFPVDGKFVSINFNESQSENSFTFTNELSDRYISPFVSLREIDVDEKHLNKYKSDVLYFGSPQAFNECLNVVYEKKLKFRFFHQHPHSIYGYCGMCNIDEYFKHYRHAKASIANGLNDRARLQDIIVAGGNPVIFLGDKDDFTNRLEKAVYEGKKYTIEGMSKQDILNKDTVFDASAKIFKKIGLNKVSKDIAQVKQKMIGKYR